MGLIMDFERINSFLESYVKDDSGRLKEIYEDAEKRGVPVIRRNTKELLRLLILITAPKRILEVGTAVGYSALFMDSIMNKRVYDGEDGDSDAGAFVGHDEREGRDGNTGIIAEHDCREDNDFEGREIITIELDEARADEAEANFDKCLGEKRNIKLLRGDAYEVMKRMTVEEYGRFDMVFIDAAKAQYGNYFEEAMRLTRKGSIIICDNILAGGEILESHFLVEKRDRTIHDRMRAFLKELKDDERLDTALLSVGDGMSVSVRIM
ncbi:MAG TPA: O-methyltransferase [Lachnospiraceae bacterium]|nr:O-methyltransferase [Lachnospiraceae bacterium]